MKTYEWRKICSILLLFVVALWGPSTVMAESHVPEGVAMQDEFRPGYGEPLGLFKKTVGRVVLVHSEDTLGYWAANDLPLYMKDLVVTPEEGLALMQFLDDSTISVAEDSELIINRFIFDPDKFDRSTFLSMDSGKSRFWVKKFEQYARSEFKVKTKTLIAGVRGSDFVIEALPDRTEVTALDDTVLEIVSLAAPEQVVVLRAFQRVQVVTGQEASPVEMITPDEAAKIKSELPMPFDRDVLDAADVYRKEGRVAREDASQETGQAATVKKEVVPIIDLGKETIILISDENLEPVLTDDEMDVILAKVDTSYPEWYDTGTGDTTASGGGGTVDETFSEGGLAQDPGNYPTIWDVPEITPGAGVVPGTSGVTQSVSGQLTTLPGMPGTP